MDPMPGMPGMPGTGPARLTWSAFWSTWSLEPGWMLVCALLLAGYLVARRRGAGRSSVRSWRVGSFATGCVLWWVSIASGIGGYAMAVFWMHMVLHLILIMIVPALLVLGHPLRVVVESLPSRRQPAAREALGSLPVTILTHPVTGLMLYTAVIVGTHLTGFMDQMAVHPWLMTAEQVLYVVTGFLFLLPLLGEEPIRADPPYLLRLGFLLLAMVPDTLVGIVLLQTGSNPFPVMMRMHPAWAPSALTDIHAAGGLMWAGGDGLMMALAVGLMISAVTSPGRRERITGAWVESVRRTNLADRTGVGSEVDPDSDEARAAYNRMLRRLGAGDQR